MLMLKLEPLCVIINQRGEIMVSKRIREKNGLIEKQCPKCERWFPLISEYFHKSKQRNDGYKVYCKECIGGKFGYSSPNKYAELKQDGYHICVKCKRSLPMNDEYFHRTKVTSTGFVGTCKECRGCGFGKHKGFPVDVIKQNKAKYQREYLSNDKNIENRLIWQINRRAIVNGLEGDFTSEQKIYLLNYFKNSCAYCGITENIEFDHFLSIKRGGATTSRNILSVCGGCNQSKTDNDFLSWYLRQSFFSEERLLLIVRYFNDVNTVVIDGTKNPSTP